MRGFTTIFTRDRQDDWTERRALLFAALVSFLSIAPFVMVSKSRPPEDTPLTISEPSPTPVESVKVEQPETPTAIEEQFRTIPDSFSHIDFTNRSYGRYDFSWKKKVNLTLEDCYWRYDFAEERGWFRFSDIYYTDVTGDGSPEAIVLLSHVSCGASCDGGATLFFVYTSREGALKEIWRYETGSLAYGCGLKSFTIMKKQLVMETFGRCPKQATEYPGPGKFMVDDLTRTTFRFNGRRFTKRQTKFLSVPTRDVKNYQAVVQVVEERSN